MYKFAYSLTKIDLRHFKKPVTTHIGIAISKGPGQLITDLYEDGFEIVAFNADALFRVFNAPNDETVFLKGSK